MNARKFYLAALAAFAVIAFIVPRSVHATPNAPAAAPSVAAAASPPAATAPAANATGLVDPNAPVKGPGQSLEAPWLANQPKAKAPHAANAMDDFYVGPTDQGETSSLDTPHRSQNEVSDFLVHAITEMLSMGVDPTDKSRKKPWTYEDHLQLLAAGMDANALAEFGTFMEKSNILQILQANNQILRIIVDDAPSLLAKGPVDGSYRWLYDVPVTMSFLTPGTKSYENAAAGQNQHVMIRMQVGRVAKRRPDHPEDIGIDEMMIQSFEVRQNSDYKQK